MTSAYISKVKLVKLSAFRTKRFPQNVQKTSNQKKLKLSKMFQTRYKTIRKLYSDHFAVALRNILQICQNFQKTLQSRLSKFVKLCSKFATKYLSSPTFPKSTLHSIKLIRNVQKLFKSISQTWHKMPIFKINELTKLLQASHVY